jgi:hypothetical protein
METKSSWLIMRARLAVIIAGSIWVMATLSNPFGALEREIFGEMFVFRRVISRCESIACQGHPS